MNTYEEIVYKLMKLVVVVIFILCHETNIIDQGQDQGVKWRKEREIQMIQIHSSFESTVLFLKLSLFKEGVNLLPEVFLKIQYVVRTRVRVHICNFLHFD